MMPASPVSSLLFLVLILIFVLVVRRGFGQFDVAADNIVCKDDTLLRPLNPRGLGLYLDSAHVYLVE